ncbi:non-ribosomal peptide synthetase [Longispora albida]|uniref:non-ribosomal peptide synthetase n=1 Tax=Longispora albida TaxID=203523 RepID=UPI0003751D53|nr:non-ribosomal peptide synthetase [Longispora albida]
MTMTNERVPLSFGQEQLWFLDQLAPGETTYNILLAWRLRGEVRTDLIRRALTVVVGRHESLRVTIHAADGTPYQVIAPAPSSVDLPQVDLSALGPDEQEKAVQAAISEQTYQPFDLEQGPLYRFTLFKLSEEDYVLCQGYHHIATDGWSSAVMNNELSAAYRALLGGEDPEPAGQAMGYTEFVRWQRDRLQGEALEEELAFWQEKLAGLPVLEIPADRPRPQTAANQNGATAIRIYPEALLAKARTLAEEHGASLFMVLSAAFSVVLARYSGQDDFPLGVPMLGRVEPELEDVVGLFTNMVVMRCDLSGDPEFTELLDRTADASLELYEHQEVPFHQVVDRVQTTRDPSRNPLFQIAVQVLGGGTSGDNIFLPGVDPEYLLLPSVRSRFDMSLNFIETRDTLKASVEYSSDLYDAWRVEAMLGHIETVLEAVTANSALKVSEIPLLTAGERAELLAAGTGEVVPFSQDPLHVRLAGQAAETPDAVAIVCKGAELTYAEFDRRAGQLARYLRARGLKNGEVVAVVIDRDLDAYVTMLGILKAGGAYAMLDPKHPASRLDLMIRDTGASLLVTRTGFVDVLPESSGWSAVLLDTEQEAIEAEGGELAEWATNESLAYILYTSGSTGTPKGVMIEHRAVAFFAEAYVRSFGLTSADRMLQLPALTFDMSQGEMWTAWAAGATVIAVAPEEALSPESLATLIREQRCTYAGLPPAIQSVIDADSYPDLRYVMGGAEVLPPELVNKWNLDGRKYLNLYGPTEAAIACTEYLVDHKVWETSPPIGRPHVNRVVYVVDQHRNLVPKGVPGELLIGGEPGGLARGYLNLPEATAEKFVADPFADGRLVYRSGDLVRWNADAQIEFVGRVDNQVKLRGLRIELGEIEAALAAHEDVDRAVVLLRPDRNGENRLVGYATGENLGVDGLRAHLAGLLPDYMVPTAWVLLDEFPLSGGWKINRKALPDPVEDGGGAEFVEPRTETEATVAGIFGEVLSLERVSAEDNFFGVGGNSLQAMRVVSRINKTFKIKINIRLLYGNATVAAISVAIDERVKEKANG